jgi:hypothetical protein
VLSDSVPLGRSQAQQLQFSAVNAKVNHSLQCIGYCIRELGIDNGVHTRPKVIDGLEQVLARQESNKSKWHVGLFVKPTKTVPGVGLLDHYIDVTHVVNGVPIEHG